MQGNCGSTGWLWRGGSDYPYPEPPEWYPCECNPHADGYPNELLDYRGTHARIAKAENTLRELARLWLDTVRTFDDAQRTGDYVECDAAWDAFNYKMLGVVKDYPGAPEPF